MTVLSMSAIPFLSESVRISFYSEVRPSEWIPLIPSSADGYKVLDDNRCYHPYFRTLCYGIDLIFICDFQVFFKQLMLAKVTAVLRILSELISSSSDLHTICLIPLFCKLLFGLL